MEPLRTTVPDPVQLSEVAPLGSEASSLAGEAALGCFERALVTTIVAAVTSSAHTADRPLGGGTSPMGALLEREWDQLRQRLGLSRLELRSGAEVTLASPRAQPRRIDEGWFQRVSGRPACTSPAIQREGAGALCGLDVDTAIYRIATQSTRGGAPRAEPVEDPEPAALCVQGETLRLPCAALGEAIGRAGLAALVLRADTEERAELRALAALGASVGARLHDLRNQLTLALFRADRVTAGDASRDHTAAALLEDLRRARELAAEGLVLPRGASNVVPLEARRALPAVGLRALVLEEARAVAAMSRAAEARIRVRCPADLEVLGDSTTLGRLVRNLLLNAAESRAGGAGITVEAARCGPAGLCLTIADDGRGFEPEALRSYLEPDRARARSRDGTGFGTASVREALVRLDGGLTVTSAPGIGTRVQVELWASPLPGTRPVLVIAPPRVAPRTTSEAARAVGDRHSMGDRRLVRVAHPLRALTLLEALRPERIFLHRATLGPGRRELLRAAARAGIPVESASALERQALRAICATQPT